MSSTKSRISPHFAHMSHSHSSQDLSPDVIPQSGQSLSLPPPPRPHVRLPHMFHPPILHPVHEPTPQFDHQGWQNGRVPIKRCNSIKKKGLQADKRYQVRVRARLHECSCAHKGGDYLKCAELGACSWTTWSLPSVPTMPGIAE